MPPQSPSLRAKSPLGASRPGEENGSTECASNGEKGRGKYLGHTKVSFPSPALPRLVDPNPERVLASQLPTKEKGSGEGEGKGNPLPLQDEAGGGGGAGGQIGTDVASDGE